MGMMGSGGTATRFAVIAVASIALFTYLTIRRLGQRLSTARCRPGPSPMNNPTPCGPIGG